MAEQWFYSVDGSKQGPVSGKELAALARSGKLTPTALVWKEGMDGWKPAGKVKGLFPAAATAPSPPTAQPTPTGPLDISSAAKGLFGAVASAAKRIGSKVAEAAKQPPETAGTSEVVKPVPGTPDECPPPPDTPAQQTAFPKLSRRTAVVAGVAGGVLLLSCVVCGVIGMVVDTGGGEIEAKVTAQSFVEKRLKAPSTAEFPSTTDFKATEIEKNVWRVSGYVDAQNSFGAKLRSNWTVTMRYEGKSKWTLISCDIGG